MRRRWKILLVAAGGLAAVWAIWFFAVREKEPSYNGRTLSEWLDAAEGRISVTGQSTEENAIQAVSKIGINAVPILLRWNREQTSHGADKLLRIAGMIPNEPLRNSALKFLWGMTTERQHQLAHLGFQILGSNSTAVVLQVAAQFNSSRDWNSICYAADALSWMGPEGVSVLQPNLESPNSLKRDAAILAVGNLHYLGTNAEATAAVLARIVRTQTNARSRLFAIMSLDRLSEVSKSAAPAIEAALNDPERLNRVEATNALATIKFLSRMNNRASPH